MKDGFIKINQRLLDWQWYDDNNVKVVFLHLLLTANQQPKLWHGQELAAGELVTGYEVLADSVGLTMQQLRTALDKLKQTGEISITTNRHHTKITVHNWEYYKVDDNQQSNKPITNQTPAKHYQNAKEQQTDNRPITNQQQTDNKPTTNKIPAKLYQIEELQQTNNKPVTNQQQTKSKIKEKTERKEKEPKRKEREKRNNIYNNYNNENLCLDSVAQKQNLGGGCGFRVLSLLSSILAGKITPQDRLVVNGFVETYGEQWTVEALEIMHKAGKAEAGKADFRYTEGILKNWRKYGKNSRKPAKGEVMGFPSDDVDFSFLYKLADNI